MSKLTPFQEKYHELEVLKKDTSKVLSKFNSLHLDYADWFKRRNKTFINIVKTLQVGAKSLVPQKISCLGNFKAVKHVAEEMQSSKKKTPQFEDLYSFMDFWERYCGIKEEMDRVIMKRFEDYSASISGFREPDIKVKIDHMYYDLNNQFSDSFNFESIHNEKDNLYTYRVPACDYEFHGLVGYIPFLVGLSTKLCYLITKINLEKL